MKYGIFLIIAVCTLGVMSACGGKSSKTPPKEPIERLPPSVSVSNSREPATSQGRETTKGQFNLGGECLPRGQYRPLALTGKLEEQVRSNGEWDTLIAAAKQDVRSDCSVPYRWEKLFTALVNGHQYREAVQVLNDMAMRAFPLPHAIVSKADPAFLDSTEFKNSSKGIEYAVRENEIQEALRLAQNELSSMPDEDRPPKLYRHVGACPFECCTYRQWKTRSAIQLQQSIDSSNIIAEIPAGVSVAGLTGEVQVEPEPYAVLEDNGIVKAGDVIFFLDYIGEGYVNYWYRGKLKPEIGFDVLLRNTYDNCQSDGRIEAPCSLRKLQPGKTFKNEWWVKIGFGGKEGWVLNTGQFDNVDACG